MAPFVEVVWPVLGAGSAEAGCAMGPFEFDKGRFPVRQTRDRQETTYALAI